MGNPATEDGIIKITALSHAPDMNITFPFIILDARNPDLAKNNRAVCGGTAPDLNEVVFNGKRDELFVTQPRRARPHPGLVLVPVMPRFDDRGLDFGQDVVERLYRVLAWWVWLVELDYFGSCCLFCL